MTSHRASGRTVRGAVRARPRTTAATSTVRSVSASPRGAETGSCRVTRRSGSAARTASSWPATTGRPLISGTAGRAVCAGCRSTTCASMPAGARTSARAAGRRVLVSLDVTACAGTDSRTRSSTPCSHRRAVSARSAAAAPDTADGRWTTATQAATSEACCARRATSASGSSGTTRPPFARRPRISRRAEPDPGAWPAPRTREV